MIKKSKDTSEDNNGKFTAEYLNATNCKIDYSINQCIDFCLQCARDDKNNSNIYLQIIKHLLEKPVNYVTYPINTDNKTWPDYTYTYTTPLTCSATGKGADDGNQ